MREKALLLTSDYPLADDRRAAQLLEFFGVPYETQRATQFSLPARHAASDSSYRLIASAQTFSRVIGVLENSNHAHGLGQQIHSALLYPNGDPVALSKIVSYLGGRNVSVRRGAKSQTEWNIEDDPAGMCGPMRGLRVRPAPSTLSSCDFFGADAIGATICSGDKAAFLKLNWRGVPIFFSSVGLLDIHSNLETDNFDVRDHLFEAVPFVSYIRWAFPQSAWNPLELSACLVVDDPLLITKYGFVCYRELLALMKQLRFSTSIAFIPWNWRRSDSTVVQLFKEHSENYSICVHGCDHTAGEFSTPNRERAGSLATEALRRMSLHKDRTGLGYDRIMVFPQGMFSAEAMIELKRAGFEAVVNTELNSNPPLNRKLRISDAWDTAVMRYGDFPIYTRRYPAQGIENFAFDLLVGKPCIVVIHHDFCSDGYSRLVDFIGQLNGLRVPLTWRSLGEVLKRSYRQKELTSDSTEIEIYCNQALIENRSDRPKRCVVRRREHRPESIGSLCAGSDQLAWALNGDYIQVELNLQPGESKVVTLRFKPGEPVAFAPQSIVSSASTMLRRFLSEARDKYLMPARARIGGFSYV